MRVVTNPIRLPYRIGRRASKHTIGPCYMLKVVDWLLMSPNGLLRICLK